MNQKQPRYYTAQLLIKKGRVVRLTGFPKKGDYLYLIHTESFFAVNKLGQLGWKLIQMKQLSEGLRLSFRYDCQF